MATMATQLGEPLAPEPNFDQTFEQPEESRAVRRVAQLFFATFWTIIFTGCIRKWLFPSTNVFYLLQDVPISLAYCYALYKGFFTRGTLFIGIILLTAILALLALVQIVILGLSPLVGFIGLHHYMYYAPMMLVFPLALTPRYRRDFVIWNLWSAIAMLPLSVAQAISPPDAWINQSSLGDAFAVAGTDVARISGPFNYTAAYGLWIGIAFALCLGEWMLPKARRASDSTLLLIIATGIWPFIALISGSRENIVICAAAGGGVAVAAAVTGSMRAIAVIALAVFAAPFAVGMVYIVNPEEFNVMLERFTDKTNSNYQMHGRIGENLYGWIYEPDFTFIGAGVGMGIDAAHVGSVDAYNFTYGLAESDTVRNVMELGNPVGYLWVLTRMLFALGMIALAWRLNAISPHCLPLAVMLFAQVVWDMTRYATTSYTQVMLGYCFIFGAAIYPYFFEKKPKIVPQLEAKFDQAPSTAA